MQKEFIPYELAVKLKELGFDEKCFGWYITQENKEHIFSVIIDNVKYYPNHQITSAPLWQQAFDFMAFKYGIHGNIITKGKDKIYITSEYRQSYGGNMSNGKVYTDIYQCRIDLLIDMIELFEEAHN